MSGPDKINYTRIPEILPDKLKSELNNALKNPTDKQIADLGKILLETEVYYRSQIQNNIDPAPVIKECEELYQKLVNAVAQEKLKTQKPTVVKKTTKYGSMEL